MLVNLRRPDGASARQRRDGSRASSGRIPHVFRMHSARFPDAFRTFSGRIPHVFPGTEYRICDQPFSLRLSAPEKQMRFALSAAFCFTSDYSKPCPVCQSNCRSFRPRRERRHRVLFCGGSPLCLPCFFPSGFFSEKAEKIEISSCKIENRML